MYRPPMVYPVTSLRPYMTVCLDETSFTSGLRSVPGSVGGGSGDGVRRNLPSPVRT